MTVGEWLRTRRPQPPDALAARLELVLGAGMQRSVSEAPDLFLACGERLVGELLRSRSTSRDSALDLLTADALVTYAFEAASHAPAAIGARAHDAMVRMAALGARQDGAA